MNYQDNEYLDLTTYPDIYRELVYQRNSAIQWLDGHKLVQRNYRVTRDNVEEWKRQESAGTFRPVFRNSIFQILERLHSHDAIEAVYDFNSIDLADWSDTAANRLDLELRQLQVIIGKLELRYRLAIHTIVRVRSQVGNSLSQPHRFTKVWPQLNKAPPAYCTIF